MTTLTVEVAGPGQDLVLAPSGITTPYDAVTGLEVEGGHIIRVLTEPELGLGACVIAPKDDPLILRYGVEAASAGQNYPEAAFQPRRNRYSVAAFDLIKASRDVAAKAGGGRAGINALVAEAQARFTYAHPDRRFNDDTEAVPYLSCGMTPGSCIDINTYLVASLRASGYDAAYFYGYFFPKERGGITNDMHCWVVTRHEGEVLEWDIAHHMKADLGATRSGLNPRPGARVAIGHSMGQSYHAAQGEIFLKLLAEPRRLKPSGAVEDLAVRVHLSGDRVS